MLRVRGRLEEREHHCRLGESQVDPLHVPGLPQVHPRRVAQSQCVRTPAGAELDLARPHEFGHRQVGVHECRLHERTRMCIKEVTEEPIDIEEDQPVSGSGETVSAEIRVISDNKRGLFGYDGWTVHPKGSGT